MSKRYTTSISQILAQITNILQMYLLKQTANGDKINDLIEVVTKQLQCSNMNSQKITRQIIYNKQTYIFFQRFLINQLLKTKNQQQIMKQYFKLKKVHSESYKLMDSSISKLAKEILENIKLIQLELKHLNQNINDLQSGSPQIQESQFESLNNLQLYYLIKIVLDDPKIQSDWMSQMLFGFYILEESITLILLKTEKIFVEITDQVNSQTCSIRSINSTKIHKKSALSESLEVYKLNQQKQEDQKMKHRESKTPNQIKSEYQMTKRPEKRMNKTQQRQICCIVRF